MLDVLQRWGQHRAEVRFFLRHNRAPSRESGKCLPPPQIQEIMKQEQGFLSPLTQGSWLGRGQSPEKIHLTPT